MADIKLTRQQIYDRIRETSKDEFVLEEMKRLGFWKTKDGSATVPELIIKKETELSKELNQLLAQKQKYQNKEAVLKEMRLKRMAEAKQKREENKKKKVQQRFEKAADWQKKKQTEIVYLGEGVSIGLNNTGSNTELLQKNGLPEFTSEEALAVAMDIPVKELRFLCFNRKVSTVNHYQKFYLPKKSGGRRLISAPMPRLKKVQHWILENILNKVTLHNAAHGFTASRSIVTNAKQHTGKAFVVNIDVKDFFPSIQFKRVKGLLRQLGYSEKIAVILALICTKAVTDQVEIDGKQYFVQKSERVLPQGAPTSPAITNILCYKLDKRLQGLATKLNCNYSRYADDISFSANNSGTNAQQLLWRIKKIVTDEGFTVHPEKIRIMRKGTKQEVTGLVVNEKMSVDRKKLRQFRAMLHQLKVKGGEHIQWGKGELTPSIIGYINFIKMVNPSKAEKFKQQFASLFATGSLNNNPPVKDSSKDEPTNKTNSNEKPQEDSDDKPWWSVI
jgi:RNA-directed DNA polymerase